MKAPTRGFYCTCTFEENATVVSATKGPKCYKIVPLHKKIIAAGFISTEKSIRRSPNTK